MAATVRAADRPASEIQRSGNEKSRRGEDETRRQIVLYSLLLIPLTLVPWYLGFSGRIYGIAAIVLGLGFLVCVARVFTDKQDATGVSLTNDAPARAAFKYSILYLFVLFAALAVDRLIG